MKIFKFFFLFVLSICLSCSKEEKVFKVAFDPAFLSLNAGELTSNVNGFVEDLLWEIARKNHINIQTQTIAYDMAFSMLDKEESDVAITAILPNRFFENEYTFSPLFLYSGLVLVVQKNSPYDSLASLANEKLLVQTGDDLAFLYKKYPNILTTPYTSISNMLDALANGQGNGALASALIAHLYVKNIYYATLRIIEESLTGQGLRFIWNKENTEFAEIFSRSIEEFAKDKILDRLYMKWGLKAP